MLRVAVYNVVVLRSIAGLQSFEQLIGFVHHQILLRRITVFASLCMFQIWYLRFGFLPLLI